MTAVINYTAKYEIDCIALELKSNSFMPILYEMLNVTQTLLILKNYFKLKTLKLMKNIERYFGELFYKFSILDKFINDDHNCSPERIEKSSKVQEISFLSN